MPLLLDALIPVRCLVCRRSGALCCAACRDALERLVEPLCARCGAPTVHPVRRCRECSSPRPSFASARAAIVLDEAARRLLAGWKDSGLERVSEVACELVVEVIDRPSCDRICAVPALRDRARLRGVDGPSELARRLAERWRLPAPEALLVRTSERRQRGAGRTARRANARDLVAARQPTSGVVLLVDDVQTTGATASACAAQLRRAGAEAVHVVTFARAVDGLLPSRRCVGSSSPRQSLSRS